MTDLIEFRRQQQIKGKLEHLMEQLDKQDIEVKSLKNSLTSHTHQDLLTKEALAEQSARFATREELKDVKADIPKPYVHPTRGVCPQKPQVHKHLTKEIVDLEIPKSYDVEQLKKDHPKLREPHLHPPKSHTHEASELTGKIKPEQIQRKGLDADTVDGKHAKDLVKRVYVGGGPHASQHETGGGDKVHFADLEHDEGDATLHDDLTATPHISQTEKDKIHDRLHALSSASDHSEINISSPTDGQMLIYDGATGEWKNLDPNVTVLDIPKVVVQKKIDLTATGIIHTPAAGKKIRIKGFAWSSNADIVTALRFGTAGDLLFPLQAKGVIAMNLVGCNIEGAVDESLYGYLSGTGTMRGTVLLEEV
jgi:hypothetical protein